MKALRLIFTVFVLNCFIFFQGTASAQADFDYSLELAGKILKGKRSDITVFQDIDHDWRIIRTMRSRSQYNLELNLKYNHYVIFQRKDGLTRAVYISKSEAGKWAINFDVNFSDFCTKNVNIYKNINDNEISLRITKISNQKLVIRKEKREDDLVTIKD